MLPNRTVRIVGRVSPEALNGWHRLTEHYGCSLAGLIEALGQHWDQTDFDDPVFDHPYIVEAGELARKIDTERRARRSQSAST